MENAIPDMKVYVDVIAVFDQDGRMRPWKLKWEDGTVYSIDKVSEVRPARAAKAGGQGDRYKIRVNNRESYLFFERFPTVSGDAVGRWFVERKLKAM